MAMKKEAAKPSVEIEILEIKRGQFVAGIIGNTPLIMHRFSNKARQELLLPSPKKNAAAKATTLKHEPIKEAKGCAYIIANDSSPTFFGFPAETIKNATANAALDIPGATKAVVGRLLTIAGQYGNLLPFWGQPFMLASMVRNSDPGRTPDVRFRIVFPQWAMLVPVKYIQPNLSAKSVYNLMSASGMITGVGDWRQEKGKGSFGSFDVCDPDDPELLAMMRPGERARQKAAFESLAAYDDETRELIEWYDEEITRRGHEHQQAPAKKKKRGAAIDEPAGSIQ